MAVGDLLLMQYDWLFFEQYLSAGLMMPIALDMLSDEKSYEQRQVRANRKKIVIKVVFYTVLIGWFIATVVTGNFIVRLSMTGIYVFIGGVYLFSLRSIKKAMMKLESKNEKEGLLQNKFLVRGYFVIYTVNILVEMAVFIVIFPDRDNFIISTLNAKQCRQVVAFAILYEILILCFTIRIVASCYMSIK